MFSLWSCRVQPDSLTHVMASDAVNWALVPSNVTVCQTKVDWRYFHCYIKIWLEFLGHLVVWLRHEESSHCGVHHQEHISRHGCESPSLWETVIQATWDSSCSSLCLSCPCLFVRVTTQGAWKGVAICLAKPEHQFLCLFR